MFTELECSAVSENGVAVAENDANSYFWSLMYDVC